MRTSLRHVRIILKISGEPTHRVTLPCWKRYGTALSGQIQPEFEKKEIIYVSKHSHRNLYLPGSIDPGHHQASKATIFVACISIFNTRSHYYLSSATTVFHAITEGLLRKDKQKIPVFKISEDISYIPSTAASRDDFNGDESREISHVLSAERAQRRSEHTSNHPRNAFYDFCESTVKIFISHFEMKNVPTAQSLLKSSLQINNSVRNKIVHIQTRLRFISLARFRQNWFMIMFR